ncbi:hypothetical protein ABH892_003648 [Paenibacillus sp. RC254]
MLYEFIVYPEALSLANTLHSLYSTLKQRRRSCGGNGKRLRRSVDINSRYPDTVYFASDHLENISLITLWALLHRTGRALFVCLNALPLSNLLHMLKCTTHQRRDRAMGGFEGGYGGWTSTGAILVLFILLVIITKAIWI